ncbi:MAG: orotidine-5'-phosphate decarboxylase [Acidobacteria bacterium]|nr:MAG: orotidine-5'-phosphate decarboxylase [Acidobacteriota bacterium]
MNDPPPSSPGAAGAPASARQRLVLALDSDDRSPFSVWVRELASEVGVLKVGLESFVRWGHEAVHEAVATAERSGASVFLDLKLHDIPNTVAGAVRAACDLGVRYLTVHAGGGERMMRAACEAAAGRLEVLAVTVLTHLDEEELDRLDLPGSASQRALLWASQARAAGCAGVVCSPLELATLRPRLGEPFLLVTPGIRPAGSDSGDQRRVATPASALRAGADLVVVGRPITRADSPPGVAREIVAEIASVL